MYWGSLSESYYQRLSLQYLYWVSNYTKLQTSTSLTKKAKLLKSLNPKSLEPKPPHLRRGQAPLSAASARSPPVDRFSRTPLRAAPGLWSLGPFGFLGGCRVSGLGTWKSLSRRGVGLKTLDSRAKDRMATNRLVPRAWGCMSSGTLANSKQHHVGTRHTWRATACSCSQNALKCMLPLINLQHVYFTVASSPVAERSALNGYQRAKVASGFLGSL